MIVIDTLRLRAIGLMGVVLLAGVAPAADSADRQFQELFGQEVKQALATGDLKDDATLAGEILTAAGTVTRGSRLQALLCEKAYELGLRHPSGHGTAEKAVQLLLRAHPDKAMACRQKLLKVYQLQYATARGSAKTAVGQKLLRQLLAVGDAHAAAGAWTEADAAYRKALGVATALRSSQRGAILARIQQARAGRERAAKMNLLQDRLQKNPSDTAARTELIRHHLVDGDDPAKASALLSADVDEAFRTYVPLACKPVKDVPAVACGELGRWYEGMLPTKPGPVRTALVRRVQAYHRKFLAGAKGESAMAIKAKLSLAKIDKELAALAAKPDVGVPLRGAVLVMTFNGDTLYEKGGRRYVRDGSGRGNHGQISGAKLGQGKAGGCLTFDGIDDAVYIPNSSSLQTTKNQTIVFWIKPTGRVGTPGAVYVKCASAEGSVRLIGDDLAYHYGPTSRESYGDRLATRAAIKANRWTHLALVRNMQSKQGTWFVNGKPDNSRTLRFPRISPSNEAVWLGRKPGGKLRTGALKAQLDELVVYGRALSHTEIKQLHVLGLRGKSLR